MITPTYLSVTLANDVTIEKAIELTKVACIAIDYSNSITNPISFMFILVDNDPNTPNIEFNHKTQLFQ